jgi:membrane protein implicated in regulation of membrane protease activity
MGVLSLWWVWLGAAIALALLETLVPGFIFLGFAAGAAIMAGLVALSVPIGPAGLFALFAGLSLLTWFVLRRIFSAPNDQTRIIDEDINN